jgi:hypothetical protein
MFARVATFENAELDQVNAAVAAINGSDGPPEGLESTGITVFADPGSGKVIVAGFFATREAMERGHAMLSQMSPPAGSFGKQTAVDLMDVVAQREA